MARPEESAIEEKKQAIYDQLQDDLDINLELIDAGDFSEMIELTLDQIAKNDARTLGMVRQALAFLKADPAGFAG